MNFLHYLRRTKHSLNSKSDSSLDSVLLAFIRWGERGEEERTMVKFLFDKVAAFIRTLPGGIVEGIEQYGSSATRLDTFKG